MPSQKCRLALHFIQDGYEADGSRRVEKKGVEKCAAEVVIAIEDKQGWQHEPPAFSSERPPYCRAGRGWPAPETCSILTKLCRWDQALTCCTTVARFTATARKKATRSFRSTVSGRRRARRPSANPNAAPLTSESRRQLACVIASARRVC